MEYQSIGGLYHGKVVFEQMGGTYHQEGDYLLPDLSLPKTVPVGIITVSEHLKDDFSSIDK